MESRTNNMLSVKSSFFSFLSNRWPLLVLIAVIIFYPLLTINSYFIMRLGIVLVIYAIVIIGAILLTPYTGIVSLGQSAFFGMGAYISAILTVRVGMNPWLAMAIAAGSTTLVAEMFCAPFLKLRAIYLAMATLGLGEIVTLLIQDWHEVTGGVSGMSGIPYLQIGSLLLKQDWQIFYLSGIFLIIAAFIADNVGRTRLGRAYHAIRTNETAAQASGINVRKKMRNLFCFAAFLASLAGSLLAHFITFVSPETFVSLSFTFLIIVIIGGANIWGGLLTGFLLLGFSEVFRGFQNLSMGLYGLLLIIAFFVFPSGLSAVLFKGSKTVKRMADVHNRRIGSNTNDITVKNERPKIDKNGKILEVKDLSMLYGGTEALSKVSFSVDYGQIVGVIGPNGAGKTTLLNIINGYLKPIEGKVIYKNSDVTFKPPHEMASLRVARTFQLINLFKGMTVIENVMVGSHLKGKAGIFESGLGFKRARREETAIWDAAVKSLKIVGLTEKAYHIVESLSFGEQRLVELARAMALQPDMLFLDEPAAGLNTAETKKLGGTIRQIRDRGVTIIIVEHNMSLVMSVSDVVCVLDFGKLIACGTPNNVCSDEGVIKAYLGKQEVKNAS